MEVGFFGGRYGVAEEVSYKWWTGLELNFHMEARVPEKLRNFSIRSCLFLDKWKVALCEKFTHIPQVKQRAAVSLKVRDKFKSWPCSHLNLVFPVRVSKLPYSNLNFKTDIRF